MELLKEIINNIPLIESQNNYWLVRTDGGRLYSSFLNQNIISIGYSKIDSKWIKSDESFSQGEREQLYKKIQKLYPEHKRPGLIISQLFKFIHSMAEGDYIIITSQSTEWIAIGQITDKTMHEEAVFYKGPDGKQKEDPEYNKCRSVKWHKRIKRDRLHPKLYQLFFCHMAVVDANEYAYLIDPLLHDFFKKNDKYHYNIFVEKSDAINARELLGSCLELFDISDMVATELKKDGRSDKVDIRINLNSPGMIELITEAAPVIIGTIALLIILINGGKFKITIEKFGFNMDIGSEGLIARINKLLNSNTDRQLKKSVKQKIGDLQIPDSKDVVKILNAINKKNQNE